MKSIVLVGFSGSGKTTIGRVLAHRLGLEFVDLDSAIEEKYHATIPHIFEKYGESVFRQCEYQTLKEKISTPDIVLSTGGGAPTYKDAMQLIKANAFSVYLNLSEESLVDRLKHSKKVRPLTSSLSDEALQEYVHTAMQKRLAYYKMADLVVDEEDVDAEKIAEVIAEKFCILRHFFGNGNSFR